MLPLILLLLRRSPLPPAFFELDLATWLRETHGLLAFPGHIDRDTPRPAIAFLVVSESHMVKLSGPAGLASTRVQFSIVSDSYMDCGQLHERLRRALVKLRGPMGRTRVDAAIPANGIGRYEDSPGTGDRGPHLKVSEFTFFHDESIPT